MVSKGDIVEITSQRDEKTGNRIYHSFPIGTKCTVVMLPEEDVDCQGAYDLHSEKHPSNRLVFPRHFKKI